MNESCVVCQRVRDGVLPQWWSLTQYHGVNGIYCPACFEKVRHKDARPVHPIAFRNALRKMDGSAPIKAHSKTEYKRLVAQGANVLPPTPIDDIERDAKRYQWLRERHENTIMDIYNSISPAIISPELLDAAIDAAMEKNT